MEVKKSESRVFFENFTKRFSVILSKMYSQISPVYLVSVMEILLAIFIFLPNLHPLFTYLLFYSGDRNPTVINF